MAFKGKKGALDIVLAIGAIILISVIGMAVLHVMMIGVKDKMKEKISADISKDEGYGYLVKYLSLPDEDYRNNLGLIMSDYYEYKEGNDDAFDNLNTNFFEKYMDSYRFTIFEGKSILFSDEKSIDDFDSIIIIGELNLTDRVHITLERGTIE